MAPAPKRGFATPPEVIAYFRDKKLRPAFSYQDVWGQEHAYAFTVAKAVDAELLGIFKRSIDEAIVAGESFETWRDKLVPTLQKSGWGAARMAHDPEGKWAQKEIDFTAPRRLRTIFWSNMRAARAAGQWERMQRTKAALPFILYERTASLDPRIEHLQWVGIVLPVDDAFWHTHFPPNGWGCKCAVRAISAREAERLKGGGLHRFDAPDIVTKPFLNKRTGEIVQVPTGLDPAWARNPGRDRARVLNESLAERQSSLKAALPLTEEGAQHHFSERTVPTGWYIHGRATGDSLDTGYVLQMTRDVEVADRYAGKKGSVWYIRPQDDATMLDLSHEGTLDMGRVEVAFRKSFEKGAFPDQESLPENVVEAWESVRPNFAPNAIVDSAGAFDNPDWVVWLYENTGADFIETPDGAVAINIAKTKAVKVPDHRALFAAQAGKSRARPQAAQQPSRAPASGVCGGPVL